MGFDCGMNLNDNYEKERYIKACEKLGISNPFADKWSQDSLTVWDAGSFYHDVYNNELRFLGTEIEREKNDDDEDSHIFGYDPPEYELRPEVFDGFTKAYERLMKCEGVAYVNTLANAYGYDDERTWQAWQDVLDGVVTRTVTTEDIPKISRIRINAATTARIAYEPDNKYDYATHDYVANDCNYVGKPVTISIDGGDANVIYADCHATKETVTKDQMLARRNVSEVIGCLGDIANGDAKSMVMTHMFDDLTLGLSILQNLGDVNRACAEARIEKVVLWGGW